MYKFSQVVLTALVILLIAGFISAQATVVNVSIVNFSFSPDTVTVDPGDTVRWTHNGTFLHTTTSNTLIWDSGPMSNGNVFQWQFNSAGSFPYHCDFHPLSMNGTVIVNGPNVAPNLVIPGTQNVTVPGQNVSFQVSATDANPGDTANISFLGLNPTPVSTTPSYTGNNPGTLDWSPICAEAGSYYAKFLADDGNGGTDTDSVLVNVACLTHYVKMIDLKFVPEVETIGPGEQVCWVHEDTLCQLPCYHTSTSDSGVWDSDTMVTNDTFCFIFDSVGAFPYHCTTHVVSDTMIGTIVVATTPCLAKPGDANASDTYTLADAIAIVNYVFTKPGCLPLPTCWLNGLLCRGDWNGSGTVTLGDAIRAVNFIFNKPGGPWNAIPIGECCLVAAD
ncbi:MAG: hypothetical protein A2142_02030 [candidate division Zixibacteria bacterium RBG_16_48_11]|nr:MAG: hypothetical protein A2142_02030 [candidate division Zixibacteria bacterium RBG_16_48_11]